MRSSFALALSLIACGREAPPAPSPPIVADTAAAPAPDAPQPAAPPAAVEAPEAKEVPFAILVPRGADRWAIVACWVVPDALAEAEPRWESQAGCGKLVAVGARVHGPGMPADAKVTRVDGGLVEAVGGGAFALVGPAGDPRLASLAAVATAPSPSGPPNAPATPVAPERGRRIPTEAQRLAVSRALKGIDGIELAGAPIAVGDAIVDDLDGDGKADAVFLASYGPEGDDHAAAALVAGGTDLNHVMPFLIDPELRSIDVVALVDLDHDLRQEMLLKARCSTGPLELLVEGGADGMHVLGATGDEDQPCAGVADAPVLAHGLRRIAPPARLDAFAGLFGVPVGTPLADVRKRFSADVDERAHQAGGAGDSLRFLLDRDNQRVIGWTISLAGARALFGKGEIGGLDVLLDMTLKEAWETLRGPLGGQRVPTGQYLVFDGPLADGRSFALELFCPDEEGACDSASAIAYTPRPLLPTRPAFLGLGRRSKKADVDRVFRAGNTNVVATFGDDGALGELAVAKAALPALKDPGIFGLLDRGVDGMQAAFGPPDDIKTSGESMTVKWLVPTEVVSTYAITATCLRGDCTRMTITFY